MPGPVTIHIGTRGLELVTTQAGHVRDALIELGQPAGLMIIKTASDRNRHDPAEEVGIGVFTQALRHALHEGMCGTIVRSFKDPPTVPEGDVVVAAALEHVDPRETLISRDATPLMDPPEGTRIDTSAPRRIPQLRALRSGLELAPLRGNIEARVERIFEDLDAVILARAEPEHTDRLGEIVESLGMNVLMPAPAQGVLALKYRTADRKTVDVLRKINHPVSHAHVVAERVMLNKLKAGCTAPVMAYVTMNGSGELILQAEAFALNSSRQLLKTATTSVDKADELSRKVTAALLERSVYKVMDGTLREPQK